jgi:hypothetical protein
VIEIVLIKISSNKRDGIFAYISERTEIKKNITPTAKRCEQKINNTIKSIKWHRYSVDCHSIYGILQMLQTLFFL